ncbi:magnesium/cobalt transporter CorA [bacterium]|nr:magnesium/cobalt transporter CorA [bacterium]
MLNCCFLVSNDKIITNYEEINIRDVLKDENCFLWIDIEDTDDNDVAILEKFGFHELSIEDCIFPQNLPKIEDFDTYCFITVHGIIPRASIEEDMQMFEINTFLGKNFVVTVHEHPSAAINTVREKIRQNPLTLTKGMDLLLHAILDRIVDSYFPLAEQIDDQIEQIEEAVLTDPTQKNMEQLLHLKRVILSMRKVILPQRTIISRLSRDDISFIKHKNLVYFRDIYDHLLRIGDMLDMYRELLTNTLEVYISGTSTKMNAIIKVLTIIATFMMPLTLITSYYGMNIPMPEFAAGSHGLVIVWTLMIGTTVGLFAFFKHKKWM